MNKIKLTEFGNRILIFSIIITGILIRIYFYSGHVFSDDAYYFELSKLISQNSPLSNYLGYPIFKLRIFFNFLNALMLKIWGIKEISLIILPFTVSVLNLFLIYYIAKELFHDKRIQLIALFLVTFFPVEIIFSTIGFPDSFNLLIINFSLLIFYKAYTSKNLTKSFYAGILISISLLVKENAIYYLILFLIFLIYILLSKKSINNSLLVVIVVAFFFLIIEGLIYYVINGDFLYRLKILNQNYHYSYYDFFPNSAKKITHSDNFLVNVIFQIVLNLKHIFLRRFYLLLPLLALFISIYNIYIKRDLLISKFFLLLSALLIAFTTDLFIYRPMNLERSWYIFPLIMPSVLIVSSFLNRFSYRFIIIILTFYFAGSILMSNSYREYFHTENNSIVKNFIRNHKTSSLYTDHFTKYSIDLISGCDTIAVSLTNSSISLDSIKNHSLLLYNKKHLDELTLQGYNFPTLFELLNSNERPVFTAGDFIVYTIKN